MGGAAMYFVFGIIRHTGATIYVGKGEGDLKSYHFKIENERVARIVELDRKAGHPDFTIGLIADNLTEDDADELVRDKRADLNL
jgi:hypothetical protein